MNILNNRKLMDMLSSEYVLGTLRGGARRRYAALLAGSPALRQMVVKWQDMLYPMAELNRAVEPPTRVWHAIEQRLGLNRRALPTANGGFWTTLGSNLRFWRALGIGSTALASLLIAFVLARQPASLTPVAPAVSYIATLSDEKSQPVAVITGDPQRHRLIVHIVTPQNVAADRSLELWAVPKQGNPQSLGLVAANGTIDLPLPAQLTPESVALMAISLEPKGGSPNRNAPSGPIVLKGPLLQI